uniref:Protein kinase domain-containing protein n=1 Tax=Peronospora matthiolae TaxID=2874970 RepID=A0AAV1VF71_9STRA
MSSLLHVRMILGTIALGYGIIFALCTCLVVYMRHYRSSALRGDTRAARRVLLPAFQPLLWLLTAVSLVYTICFTLLVSNGPYWAHQNRVKAEVYYSGRLFVIALPVLYLQQRAVTTRALIRAAMCSLLLAVYNIPIVWIVDLTATVETAHYVIIVTGSLPLVVLEWICLRPSERASRKTLREYAVFVGVYYIMRATYTELYYLGEDFAVASFVVTLMSIFWGSLVPVVIWRVLKADTAHWRGLGKRAVHLQSLFRQKYHYLHERVSSRGLHLLIEMHRKQIIDFAYLELQRKIGAGASAVVFRGTLHSKIPVAIKVYTPRVLCEDVVAAFSHEAALSGALLHPNIVRFYGMCVCPPTVCLVSELCRASLEEVTRTSARMRLLHQRSRSNEREQDVVSQGWQQRQQLLIDLNYMIDATRAVVYMHSFTPAFLHRDLKPSNFMVDYYGTCKLTDFGESRSVPTEHIGKRANNGTEDHSVAAATVGASSTMFVEDACMGAVTPNAPAQVTSSPSLLGRDRGRNTMTVRGTADYMAPELIEGKAGTAVYGEAADIYSLAITLWDIVHPLVPKYPDATRSHLQVFDSVLDGERPPLSPSLHPELHRLMTDAWHSQPERRPSAAYILTALETLQQEVSAPTALRLVTALDCTGTPSTPSMVKGQHIMQRMVELDFVDSASEAYRMGNSLMSAGLLHHSQHRVSFRKTSELFYFDADVLGLYAPASPDTTSGTSKDSRSSNDNIDDPVPTFFDRRHRHISSGDHGQRAASSPVATRCFSPPAANRQSVPTACHRASTELPACGCRRLGRGFINPACRQKRRFRRSKKWLSIAEERISTGKLLFHDVELVEPFFDETDDFEDYSISGNWDDTKAAATATVRGTTSIARIDENIELELADTSCYVNFETSDPS